MSESVNWLVMRSYLEEQLPSYLEMLEKMVNINSFTANPEGVNELGKLTAELFANLGFEAEFVSSVNENYGQHLVLTRNGRSDKALGFVSHLDTVFPAEEEKRNNFHWRISGERIYGPGTVDIKGGTVMMYMVLDGLRQHAPEIFEDVNWTLLLDSSEEVLADDFGKLCVERLSAQNALACLVFEGGSFDQNQFKVVVARKGMAVCRFAVEGKASHAGSAHEVGANAVVQMADMISKIAKVTDYEKQVTVNVGFVSGGTVPNRVPHHAEAALEMRAFDKTVFEEALSEITAIIENPSVTNGNGDFVCTVKNNISQLTAPWPRNEGTDRLFAIWQQAAEEVGYSVIEEYRGGLSDGNNIWHTIPTVDGLGPAGGNAHCSERSEDGRKDQEYCYVPSFVPKAMVNIAGILRLLKIGD